MSDWAGLFNTINYVGEKIDASPWPVWIKWPLVFLVIILVLYYILQIFWSMGRRMDEKVEKEEGIEEYAEAKILIDERINDETDPEKKALLIKERDETLARLEPK